MDVSIAVATFGEPSWKRLAMERAMPSANRQALTLHAHADTLAAARNKALEHVKTEWVIFLDADDELEPGYVEAMSAGTADLRAPAVRYVQGNRPARPRLPRVAGHRHPCTADCLEDGNWLVVGTAARTQMLRDVGGWWDEPLYEDWSLWRRCWKAGATVEAISDAIYRAHWRADSRNRAPTMAVKNRIHQEIVAACP